MKFPDEPRPGDSIRDTVTELMSWCRANNVVGISGGRVAISPNGKTLFLSSSPIPEDSGIGAGECFFGEITTWTDGEGESATTKTGIKGGIVYCGNKNFSVPHKELNLESSGTWLVYLEIDCEVNRDDDHEIILPGIKTSAETDPSTFWDKTSWSAGPPETQYPDNTEPTVADGLGTIIIPIGKLEIADGAATLANVDCGHITIGQCGGVLNHTRG